MAARSWISPVVENHVTLLPHVDCSSLRALEAVNALSLPADIFCKSKESARVNGSNHQLVDGIVDSLFSSVR